MKKFFVLIFVSVFALVGCGNTEKEDIISFDKTELVANEDGSFEVSGHMDSGSLVNFNDSTIFLQPDADGNFKTLITTDNPVDTVKVVATKPGEEDVTVDLTIDNQAYKQANPSEISLKLNNDEIETNENGEAIIEGSTESGANVSIGMGNSVVADDQGNFSLSYTLSSPQEEALTINANKGDATASADIKVKPSQKMIDQDAQEKDITILSDEPTDDQRMTLQNLANQQFDRNFPYKGSKIHSLAGVIQPWAQSGDAWFYKAEATVVNEYGAERDCVVEFTITPTGPDSGDVEINAY